MKEEINVVYSEELMQAFSGWAEDTQASVAEVLSLLVDGTARIYSPKRLIFGYNIYKRTMSAVWLDWDSHQIFRCEMVHRVLGNAVKPSMMAENALAQYGLACQAAGLIDGVVEKPMGYSGVRT